MVRKDNISIIDIKINTYTIYNIYIISGYHIPQSCIEMLIKNLPKLSHLFVRRCETDIKLAFLQNIIKESPSPCLKINHLEGIITWKNGTTEFKKHPNDQVDPTRHLYGMNPN